MSEDLSICIVNWNVKDLLRDCLRSIYVGGAEGLSFDVIVVDNASTDGSQILSQEFPQVHWVQNTTNVGFARANNQALAHARGRYVCFLNPDTVVKAGALTALVHYLDAHPRVGIVGPRLYYPDRQVQPSRRRFPTLLMALMESTPLAWLWPTNPWARRYRMEDIPDHEPQEVDWVTGACMVVRGDVLNLLLGFDEGFFMYSEELDLCRRAVEAGWRVAYVPQAEVIHVEGKSSAQVVAARHLHFNRSKVRYFHKFHGPRAANLVCWGLRLQFAWQTGFEGAKWLIGHKRPLRAARVRAYWRVVQMLGQYPDTGQTLTDR